MRNILILFCLLITKIVYANNLEIVSTINEKDYKIASIKIVKNYYNLQNCLFVFSYNDYKGKLKIYDSKGSEVFIKGNIDKYIYSEKTFTYNKTFFFFSKELFFINLTDFSIDSIYLEKTNYHSLQISPGNSKDILIASYENGIDIYNLKSFKIIKKIKRKESINYDFPIILDNFLIFLNADNELAAYSFKEKSIIWNINTGKQGAYLLGIKIGTFNDKFSDYKIFKKNNLFSIYATTFSGCLYKINALNGKVIQKKERFKGKGNNAGLIRNISLIDINHDGIKDLLGASVDHNIYCIDGSDFSIIWEHDTGNENQMPLSLYDINGDDIPEVFGVNDYEMKLSIIDGKKGTLIDKVFLQNSNEFIQSTVTLADFNGNGYLNLITKGDFGIIKIFEFNNVKIPKNKIIWQPYD